MKASSFDRRPMRVQRLRSAQRRARYPSIVSMTSRPEGTVTGVRLTRCHGYFAEATCSAGYSSVLPRSSVMVKSNASSPYGDPEAHDAIRSRRDNVAASFGLDSETLHDPQRPVSRCHRDRESIAQFGQVLDSRMRRVEDVRNEDRSRRLSATCLILGGCGCEADDEVSVVAAGVSKQHPFGHQVAGDHGVDRSPVGSTDTFAGTLDPTTPPP